MSPRALAWLGKRHRQQERKREYYAALICSTLVNYSTRKLDKPATPADFMRIETDGPKQPEKRRGRNEIASLLRDAFGKLPGVAFIPGE
jgi:hypothetical protein